MTVGRMGRTGYLAKLFSPRALREKIDELIAGAPRQADGILPEGKP